MPRARKDGAAQNIAPFDDLSTELVNFAADFEIKILQPVREKRAAGDEVLAIQEVALGVSTEREGEDRVVLVTRFVTKLVILQYSIKAFIAEIRCARGALCIKILLISSTSQQDTHFVSPIGSFAVNFMLPML